MLVYKACHVNTGIDIVRIDYRGINKIFSFKLIRILKEIMSKTTEKQEIWCIHEVCPKQIFVPHKNYNTVHKRRKPKFVFFKHILGKLH